MDEFAASVLDAKRVATTLEVPSEEIVRWMSQFTQSTLEPGVAHIRGGGRHLERYLRFKRDQAFVEAYLDQSHELTVLWRMLPSSEQADPRSGTHNLSTLNSQVEAGSPTLGDIATIDLGTFFNGYEHEVLPIIRRLADSGCMIWVPQVSFPDYRLETRWFTDEFAYVCAVDDGDLFRPGHPAIDF
jgi:hypothetical protein